MMKISVKLSDLLIRSLVESVTVDVMELLVKRLIPAYDLRKQTGFTPNIPTLNKDAAAQIVRDLTKHGLILHFASLLIDVHQNGLTGHTYAISYLREIIRELQESGFVYDHETRIFVEDSSVRATKNWGVLREGEEYIFTFLRLDIVGNSKLVRQYPQETIQSTYDDLRALVTRAVSKRNGRIWSWEGDGGLVCFYFSHKNNLATISSMEIISELFIYNLISCKLDHPLGVRLAVHCGPCLYERGTENIKNETIKRTVEIESKYTRPNTVTVSDVVYSTLDPKLSDQFRIINPGEKSRLYNYELQWEK